MGNLSGRPRLPEEGLKLSPRLTWGPPGEVLWTQGDRDARATCGERASRRESDNETLKRRCSGWSAAVRAQGAACAALGGEPPRCRRRFICGDCGSAQPRAGVTGAQSYFGQFAVVVSGSIGADSE